MKTLSDWLAEEPFTLGLSSGYFGFFAHCGVVSALEEAGLFPCAVAGSSAGALVAGLWGAGIVAADLRATLSSLRRTDFWDPRPGLGLLRGDRFAQMLDDLLPVRRFEECPILVTVSVFDIPSLSTRAINRGLLAPAIQASCTLPLLFQPRPLHGRPSLDGGILDRPGLSGVSPASRTLYHHLASRSPWRTQRALRIPDRAHGQTLVIEGLPRLGPFRLADGPRALSTAWNATRRALQLEIPSHSGNARAPIISRASSRAMNRR